MQGSCSCGAVWLEWPDEQELLAPITSCHCRGCRKLSGTFTTNLVLPTTAITIHGTPKIYLKTDTTSGNPAKRAFCGDCSAVLFTQGTAFPGVTVVKSNVLDVPEGVDEKEFWNKWSTPAMEGFCRTRAEWLPEFEGAKSWEASPMGEGAKAWRKEKSGDEGKKV